MLPVLLYGGSVLGMIISLKNNARPRRKPFESLKREYKHSLRKHYGLEYHDVSKEKLEKVKLKIRKKLRNEERIRYLKITVFAFIICSLLFTGVSIQLKRNNEINRQNRKAEKISAMTPAEQFKEYLNNGYQLLNEEKYNDAKYLFLSALRIEPDNYKANLALTEAYIKNCVFNDTDCAKTENLLENNLEKFGRTDKLIELKNLLYSKI